MSVEQRHQHQLQPQPQKPQQQLQQRSHQPHQQQHVHCSYERDIVCDEIQTHQQHQPQSQQEPQQHDEQHIHCHAHIAYSTDQLVSTPHRHQQQQQLQRKHSHSPHHSRHTSPHSHHSHSQHSSPHQPHHRVHEQHSHINSTDADVNVDSLARSHAPPIPPPRPSTQSSSSHAHHHHHHRRRRRQQNHQHGAGGARAGGGGSAGGSGHSSTHAVGAHGHSHQERLSSRLNHHSSACTRRHRSATDVSSTSINTCHDPTCVDREVQEILVRKSCCSNSRTELAQYFAEDLYGSSRRPSSCCTSSDYCYQTDSTSLYGSRSSLSRNNSIKSASVVLRKRRLTQRRPSYTSISLRGLNASRPNSQLGSLTSIFDGDKKQLAGGSAHGSGKMIVSPSKVTIERQTSKDALSNDLPEYACSPSPIRWSFLADGKSPTEFDGAAGGDKDTNWKPMDECSGEPKYEHDRGHSHGTRGTEQRAGTGSGAPPHSHPNWKSPYDERPSTSAAAARKCRDSPFSCDFEQSTTVLFHQEGEAYNNCCSNYVQCNTYLDQDLQITSEDIQQYLSKGNRQMGDVLNNSKSYPFQPSNALEFQYKNNFANNNSVAASSECGDSVRGGFDGRFRRNSSKETNLNQNSSGAAGAEATTCAAAASSCRSRPLSPTNINLSSSTNNINIVFNPCLERNANEVKFINTVRDNVVSTEAHHSGYLPYMYPTYDYTNMSANSLFDKPLGIDELPKEFAGAIAEGADGGGHYTSTAAIDDQPPSVLHSPVQVGASFESFDAASNHNLLSHRGSCQFSSTPRSPLSPASPASSCLSASINPAAASYVHTHQSHFRYQQGERHAGHSPPAATHLRQPHAHHSQFHHHHFTESFKFSNAFKRVRRRARKYAEYLRKK